MAAVLALTCVPVILLAVLSFGAATAEGNLTGVLAAILFVSVLFGATLGLFKWAQSVDNAEDHAEEAV